MVHGLRLVRQLLSVRQVAEMLSVSRATVYAMLERGELERVWVVTSIRIPVESVEALIRRGSGKNS